MKHRRERLEGRGTIASPGRWAKRQKRGGNPEGRFCSSFFVHHYSEAVVPRPSGGTANGGFTLVEILATFVLIAIILPVAMNGISMAGKLANQAKRRVEAATIAQQTLNNLILSGDYEDGDQEGEATGDNTAYAWRLEVLDWEEEDAMQQLDLSVTWEESGGGDNIVVLSTLVYAGSE